MPRVLSVFGVVYEGAFLTISHFYFLFNEVAAINESTKNRVPANIKLSTRSRRNRPSVYIRRYAKRRSNLKSSETARVIYPEMRAS